MGRWLTALLLAGLAPREAAAFLTPAEYEAPAWVGGGDGRAFTGAPRWSGWGCNVCHVPAVDPPLVVVTSDPAELLADRRYVPARRYVIHVEIADERLFPTQPTDPIVPAGNAFAAEFAGAGGAPAGTLDPCLEGVLCPGAHETCDPDACGEGAPPTTPVVVRIADRTAVVTGAAERTAWDFAWTAPPAGTGSVTLHVAVVDGSSDRDQTGDAVAIGAVPISETSGTDDAALGLFAVVAPSAWRRIRSCVR